jgi:hypothetical protein
MYQTIFIKFLQINNFNITSEIEKLSSIYKFNIKKILHNKKGAIVEIYTNSLPLLQKNTNIIIIYECEFYNRDLTEYLKYKKKK